jgi:hypothetical protein
MLVFFEKKGPKIFSKNNLGATEFYGKMGERIIVDFFRIFNANFEETFK